MDQISTSQHTVVVQKGIHVSAVPATHKVSERNFGLDLLRSIAIMLVLVAHGLYLYYEHLPSFIGNNLTLAGHWGVQLFFVLSGFLIGTIFIKEIAVRGFYWKVVLNFWKRRWFRTIPNYYLFLVVYILLALFTPTSFLVGMWKENVMVEGSWEKLLYFPVFLQNFRIPEAFFGQTWSLCVEEWFYLTLPVTFLLVSAIYGRRNHIGGKRMALVIGIMIVLFVSLRFAGLTNLISRYNKLAMIYNLDNLMVGVGLAWVMINYKAKVLAKRNLSMIGGVVLFLAGWLLQNKYILTGSPVDVVDAIIIPMQALSFAAILPWFYALKLKKRTIVSRLITEISLVSYSAYLVHLIVLIYIINKISSSVNTHSVGVSIFLFSIFLIITLGISSLNYRLFEKRMTALRDNFSVKWISYRNLRAFRRKTDRWTKKSRSVFAQRTTGIS